MCIIANFKTKNPAKNKQNCIFSKLKISNHYTSLLRKLSDISSIVQDM